MTIAIFALAKSRKNYECEVKCDLNIQFLIALALTFMSGLKNHY